MKHGGSSEADLLEFDSYPRDMPDAHVDHDGSVWSRHPDKIDMPTEMIFLDIGANLGYFSQLALGLGVDHVMAIEPVLRNAHKLAKSAVIYNNFTKVYPAD